MAAASACPCDAVALGCDGVLLDLHGAMVTRSHDDGEGELLRRIRAIAADVPIGVALDMHTNLYDAFARDATVIAGYQTYPHVDMHETGLRAGRALLALLAGTARPTMAWGRRDMLPHVMRQGTDDSPNRELQARCREMEAEGALSASVFVGFPNADIEFAGLSAVVVTDGDAALAREAGATSCSTWPGSRARNSSTPSSRSPSRWRAPERIADAAPPGSGPVVLLDHSDNCASGGTMDTMTVLGAILDAGLDDVVAFAVFDPAAVQEMIAAGVGADVTLSLGGKLDMPAIGLAGVPRTVSGRVRLICDGRYRNRGPMARGEMNDMGPTRGARHRQGADRRHLEPCRAARPGGVHRRRHRARDEALRHAEEPHPLARRPLAPRACGRRVRRHGSLHLGLRDAELQERAPADLPARRLILLRLAAERTVRLG